MFEATTHPSRQRTLLLVTLGLLVGFAYMVYLVAAPNHFPMSFVRGEVTQPAEGLMFGPYPVEEELLKLKRMGVVEVVSLLDADSPIEGPLLERERVLVEKLGMAFVNHPLPVSFAATGGDPTVLARVADYIRGNPVSLRYVHCYLGRHRVKLVEDRLQLALPAP